MIIELEMLQAKLSQVPGFPDSLKTLVEHLIISHHGQYDFGSPKLPMFPEALLLHYLDDLDSKMEAMRTQFERGGESEGAWTAYNPSLGRPLLNTAKFLARKERPESELEEDLGVGLEVTGPVEIKTSDSEVNPARTGLEPAGEEKHASTMTSAAHEDKI
jgi:3'-5' exoribonuclease